MVRDADGISEAWKNSQKCQKDVLKKKKLKMTGIKIIKINICWSIRCHFSSEIKRSLVCKCFSYTSTLLLFLSWFASVILRFCCFLPKIAWQAAFSAWECSKKLLFTYHTFLRCGIFQLIIKSVNHIFSWGNMVLTAFRLCLLSVTVPHWWHISARAAGIFQVYLSSPVKLKTKNGWNSSCRLAIQEINFLFLIK